MQVRTLLIKAPIDALDAELLLARALACDRAWLAAHPDAPVAAEAIEAFEQMLRRREAREPIAYILGEREFYGRRFRVTHDTLIPRPATETLVALALDVLRTGKGDVRDADTDIVAGAALFGDVQGVRTVVDVGTGSGCIAITLACENPQLRCIGIDVSSAALDVARENAERLGVGDRCTFLQGSLLDPVRSIAEPFLLVSNPPYVPDDAELMRDVAAFEPVGALFAGTDGMAVLRPLLTDAQAHPSCRGVAVECREEQWEALAIRRD